MRVAIEGISKEQGDAIKRTLEVTTFKVLAVCHGMLLDLSDKDRAWVLRMLNERLEAPKEATP